MTELYRAHYASTDDPETDAATKRLEDKLQSMEEILRTCAQYSVRARVEQDGKQVGEIVNGQFVRT